jgi:glycosyltransferase involved in cell wall biosynthesis
MKMVIFCHPRFAASQSMPRFADMLASSYRARGHEVEVWQPEPKFFSWMSGTRFAKWGGYVDQYVRFPRWVRKKLASTSADTLFVFCDQALGPWVPLVRSRPHVVHVHDLLALRSALGLVAENPTQLSGRLYQRYIRRGFRRAKHFISISEKSREDLHRYGGVDAETSDVVYNGLNYPYVPLPAAEALQVLGQAGLPATEGKMLLHVGGAQWYKNRTGLIALYSAYAAAEEDPLPLWCIGPAPNAAVRAALAQVPTKGSVQFFSALDGPTLQAAYSHAAAFLFPSLAEGFGWPIVEAMACRCPVLTTGEAPMSEVGGAHAFYVPRLGSGGDVAAWAARAAGVLRDILRLSPADREQLTERALQWSRRYDAQHSIEGYLSIYRRVLGLQRPAALAAA